MLEIRSGSDLGTPGLVCYTRPMKTVNLYEAKTQLSRLVQEAVLGEDIVIAKNGEPMVKLVPIRPYKRSEHLGTCAHMFSGPIDWEKFDEPLDEFEEYT